MPSEQPKGWRRTLLGQEVDLVMGQSPPSALCNIDGKGLPFFQGNADFGPRHPVARMWISKEFKVAEPGDTLISVRAPVAELNTANQRCVIGRGLAAIRPRTADRDFVCYLLHANQQRLRALGQGSTFDAIGGAELRGLPVCLPPLAEQKKIAAILSSVDEAIQATQAVIEQTRRVKEALLQDLLTLGVGHTHHTETPIGELPASWEAASVDLVARRGSGHTPSKSHPEYWNGAIKWVSLADSHRLDRVYISDTDKTITPAGIANSSAVVHPPGTVLVSRDASVGRSAIATCSLAVSQHFIAWQCGPRLNNVFFYYFLQHHKPAFERIAVGSTIKTIGLGYFKSLLMPLPPLAEQRQIANALLAHDEAIWAAEATVDRLRTVKSGLLQDLLTGRVRVST